jgi:hypothetical protein
VNTVEHCLVHGVLTRWVNCQYHGLGGEVFENSKYRKLVLKFKNIIIWYTQIKDFKEKKGFLFRVRFEVENWTDKQKHNEE